MRTVNFGQRTTKCYFLNVMRGPPEAAFHIVVTYPLQIFLSPDLYILCPSEWSSLREYHYSMIWGRAGVNKGKKNTLFKKKINFKDPSPAKKNYKRPLLRERKNKIPLYREKNQ